MTENRTSGDLDQFVTFAAELGRQFAEHSARHDRDGTFVDEAFAVLRDSGYLALAVPTELGGMGATIGQVAMAQAEMARHDASAALAIAMHLHVTLFGAWRFRRTMPGAENMLRRVVDERIVLVSTGGADFTRPNGEATKVDGGFRVSGRKVFASQVPQGDVFSTMFTYDDPEAGRQVLSMAIPVRAEGVSILDTWDTMGMRGTGSHDVMMSDVFVGDAQVMSRRPWGVLDPPLMTIMSHAIPVISGVYLGVAEGARDQVIATTSGTEKALDPLIQRLVGLMDYKLRVARWSLVGALTEVGDDPAPSMQNVVAVMQAKRAIAQEAVSACDTALEITGGSGYFRRAGLEQALRDVKAVIFHPLPPELTLLHAGKVALGVAAAEM
ncbi:MAG TPA: acyl-CoA dehydrogenase family protein [Acidimicrobiales bacterium]|nr:acyl-CoA dehydrogenase family protein [Acidimicrobiales bacterium]